VLTEVDSTGAGGGWTVFLTATHTSDPSIWFASPPDSGYSVDNVPPSPPTGLALVDTELSWDAAPESDFEYHSVYGSAMAEFDLTAILIGYTVEPTYDVSTALYEYYHVTTTDHAGNEGDAASVGGGLVSLPEVTIPAVFSLLTAGPNPFEAGTSLTITVPEAGELRLTIHDVSGRLVRTALTGAYPAGFHSVTWDARDDAGRAVSPGIYFARVRAGEDQLVQRLTLVR